MVEVFFAEGGEFEFGRGGVEDGGEVGDEVFVGEVDEGVGEFLGADVVAGAIEAVEEGEGGEGVWGGGFELEDDGLSGEEVLIFFHDYIHRFGWVVVN